MVKLGVWSLKLNFQQLTTRLIQQLNFASRAVLLSSLLALSAVAISKRLGVLQPLEMASFDFMTRLQTYQPPDDRLLIVEITESDLEAHGWPLSDEKVATVIANLQKYEPAVVGLDLYRNISQSVGREALLRNGRNSRWALMISPLILMGCCDGVYSTSVEMIGHTIPFPYESPSPITPTSVLRLIAKKVNCALAMLRSLP
jgi:hypothetical protein